MMTRTIIQPPYLVSGPLRNSRHSRPAPWIRRLVSRPGMEAYPGRSLLLSHAGGLFHPGTAVDPEAGLGAAVWGATGTLPASLVGAVTGGVGDAACVCADTAIGSASAAPRMRAPTRRAWAFSMGIPPRFALIGRGPTWRGPFRSGNPP